MGSSRKSLKISILILLTIFIVALSSCESYSGNAISPLSRGEVLSYSSYDTPLQTSKNNVQVKEVDDVWMIALKENLTTGYSWSVNVSGDGKIEILNDEYVTNQNTNDLLGAPSSHVWTFKAKEKGTVVLNFVYSRPWNTTDIADRKTYIYSII